MASNFAESSHKNNWFQRFRVASWPFVRLLIMGASVLIMGFIALYAARQVGLSVTPLSPLASEAAGPWVFRTTSSDLGSPYTRGAILNILQSDSKSVPVIELRASRDGVWFIWGEDELEQWTNGKGRIETLASSEIKNLKWLNPASGDEGPVALADLPEIKALPHLAIIARQKDPALARSLVSYFGNRESPQITFAFSPFHIFNRELRKLRPTWYFGADQAQLSQWHVFAAFGLEPFASSDFDWLMLDTKNESPANFAPRVWHEIMRRKIPAVWKVPPFPEKMPSTVLGIMTNRPNQAFEKLDSQ